MKQFLFTVISILCGVFASAQSQKDIDDVLIRLSGKSENITKDSGAQKLIVNGKKLLPELASRFTDSTTSAVFSRCAKRYLTRGELAIIIADHIEGMPYFLLTGLQNCTLETCPDNPNRVEYYLNFIKMRGMQKMFQQKYYDWLNSPERKRYL